MTIHSQSDYGYTNSEIETRGLKFCVDKARLCNRMAMRATDSEWKEKYRGYRKAWMCQARGYQLAAMNRK